MNLIVESFAGLLSVAAVSIFSFQSVEFSQAALELIAQYKKN
ncbi:hypothetical protein [Alteribacter keqinensis]|nr:hypothetical protein [Alteribacter keqinensis]